MTIREELREKYRRVATRQMLEKQEKDKKIEEEAKKFIADIIIPEFREISEKAPLMKNFYILFSVTEKDVVHASTIDAGEIVPDSRYDPEIIKKAAEIASIFDITAQVNEQTHISSYEFSLDLE